LVHEHRSYLLGLFWHESCILLGSAMLKAPCVIIKKERWQILSLERWNIQFIMSVGQRKNLSPWWESYPWPPVHWLSALTIELMGDLWPARSYLLGLKQLWT